MCRFFTSLNEGKHVTFSALSCKYIIILNTAPSLPCFREALVCQVLGVKKHCNGLFSFFSSFFFKGHYLDVISLFAAKLLVNKIGSLAALDYSIEVAQRVIFFFSSPCVRMVLILSFFFFKIVFTVRILHAGLLLALHNRSRKKKITMFHF